MITSSSTHAGDDNNGYCNNDYNNDYIIK
jgi:hypothetical protein